MSAGPRRDGDNNRKYESGYQKRKETVKRKESEVLQEGGLLKFLKPTNIEEETSLNDESKHSEILSVDIASSNSLPSCLSDDDPGKWPGHGNRLGLFPKLLIVLSVLPSDLILC
jgi:hypothetical protein